MRCALLLLLAPSAGSEMALRPRAALRASAKLSYQRVSELEARLYSRQLLRYSNLGLDGESDAKAISAVTSALVFGGATSGALVVQELPGPDIVRWCVSALLICSPYAFLSLGLTTPGLVQRAVSAGRRLISPAYRARMLRHEAGHFLAGYLVGLPVTRYSANAALSAVECGPPVRADGGVPDGTRARSQPGAADVSAEDALNRLAVVSLAGIVAECLCFGQAEGGLADLSQLHAAQLRARALGSTDDDDAVQRERGEDERNRVRWAAVQAYALLHGNGAAFERLVRAMGADLAVRDCEAAIDGERERERGRAPPAAFAPAALAEELAEPWAYANGQWPVERRAKASARAHKSEARSVAGSADDATAAAALNAAVRRARDVVTRDPQLSAAVVAMIGAVSLVAEAVAKGTPLT